MKVSFYVYALGALGPLSLVSAAVPFRDAGARSPAYAFPLPKISPKAIELVQSQLFQEYLEIEFYNQGIKNFSASGYGGAPKIAAETLKRARDLIKYQAETTVELLKLNGAKPVQPCKYVFPFVTKFSDFRTVARILANARIDSAEYLSQALVFSDPFISSTVGASNPVLARVDAFFRILNGFPAIESAFATPINPQFAFHIVEFFLVPNSCPKLPPSVSHLPRLGVADEDLTIPSDYIVPKTINWIWDPKEIPQAVPGAKIFVAFHNQLSKPEFLPLTISAPGKGSSKRPDDVFGSVYALFTNKTSAIDVDGLAATALSGPLVFGGPWK